MLSNPHTCQRRLRRVPDRTLCLDRWFAWVVASTFLGILPSASAQEALRNSMASAAAAEARHAQQLSPDYTWKSGDFRMLVRPSLNLEWNDNVNSSQDDPEQDFILTPQVQLNASYPLTRYNALNLTAGVGYRAYLDGTRRSGIWLQSGSELSFDIYVDDLWINLHDRFSYTQDPAQDASLAETGDYGEFLNTVGLSATWDLRDLVLTLGYDHQNDLSTADEFSYRDQASEMLVGRAGLQLHPTLTVGLEATTSFTTYDEPVLNDNIGYSAGVYATWQPGHYFQLQPRFGYVIYDFTQTSLVMPAENQDAWYADLKLTHQPTESISYSLSAGRELRLGTYSDTIESWYVRPNVSWSIIKNLSLTTYLSYEDGSQGLGLSGITEAYDWFGGGFGVSFPVIKRLRAGLNYRFTIRASDAPSRDYTQNVVGLMLSYQFE